VSNIKPNLIKGQGLVEYAIILVMVAVVIIAILALLGPNIGNVFSRITSSLYSSNPVEGGIPTSGGGETETPTLATATPDGGGGGPPEECYSSLLIAIMVGTMGIVTLLDHFLPQKVIERLSWSFSKRFDHSYLN
jgi:pilus assembly protein Flp/PilA